MKKEIISYIIRGYRYQYKIDINEIKYLRKRLNRGDVAVDIGAHKGGYLYWMEKSIKQKGKVYAFEPQLKLYRLLKKIIELKKYKNVIIENLGISNKEGDVIFCIPKTEKGYSPGARIGFTNDKTTYEETKIQTSTLDKYFFDRQIKIDLIKIDVEGHEKEVLLGGIKLLKLCKPSIIMECENRHLKEGNVFHVFNILIKLGYTGYFFENKKLKSIKDFNEEVHQKTGEGRFWERKGYINNFIFEPTISNKG